MNIRQLEYFLAVASELNFTRAAEKLYVSQTAVTKEIQSLEEQLGGQLEAGFTLLEMYEDTGGAGRLHDMGIPTFIATRAVKGK